jgi:ABC-type nitrate/sulfonate/bicarbonate transport system permease component
LIASPRIRDFLIRAASLAALIVLWQAGSLLLGPRKLPSPAAVAFVGGELSDWSSLPSRHYTVARNGAFVAMAIGCAVESPWAGAGFRSFFELARRLIISGVVACALLSVVRLSELAVVSVAVNKIPNVA